MGRPKSMQGRRRINLELTSKTFDNIDRLQELSNAASKTEVIARALALYDVVLEHRNTGGRVVLEKDDDRVVLCIL